MSGFPLELMQDEWLRQLKRLQAHKRGPAFFAISGLASLCLLILIVYHGPIFSYATTYASGNLAVSSSRGVTILPVVDDQSGTVKLTKVVRSGNTRSVESEVSTATFLGICKDRLAQLYNVRGLSSRCRKVLLDFIKDREKERREEEGHAKHLEEDGKDSQLQESSQVEGVDRVESIQEETQNDEDVDRQGEEAESKVPPESEADDVVDMGTEAPHLDEAGAPEEDK
mmetsp:Transcript_38587/g.83909  ORF Transcript_38587/g.83909 Transcript_38587/m.83909 type:complete len:227 (-) Transcript_38587:135-815(-)|eukprot:CAMPEP_0118923840 /NCGR_PEP_ID=MMETSP1169-20130426/2226_1 /TAXON_ID=36882 /ORGANISM="Pyramimonas obovata, Strain CCMP722" /LENGTH=226 /DNA_ID=CAMNT_0006864893 /DNA_START=67 /DNA_END=747 /DNA_ORIENTATION=+